MLVTRDRARLTNTSREHDNEYPASPFRHYRESGTWGLATFSSSKKLPVPFPATGSHTEQGLDQSILERQMEKPLKEAVEK